MKNLFLNKAFCSVVMSFIAAPTLMAQTSFAPGQPRIAKKLTMQQRLDEMEKFRKKYPLLASNLLLGQSKTNLRQSKAGMPVPFKQPVAQVPMKAPNGTVIWANIYTTDNYGFYSFTPKASITPQWLNTESPAPTSLVARYGVQLKGSKLYGVYADMASAEYGPEYASPYRFAFNTTDWTAIDDETGLFPSASCRLIAQETAMAADGTVYGEFYKEDLSGFEWGTVDYETEQFTSFGDAERKYVAIGITSKNELYGVAADGNLYKISTVDGSETLIGATGLSLTVSDEYGSQVYSQTGEIDQRTDIFYWAAVDAKAQTGLYTIDLQTGKATKIGDFGSTTGMVGMVIPQEIVDDAAPGRAENLKVSFSGESLSGTLSFKAPTKTYGGSTLTGNLTYSVKANGEELATGSVKAGEEKQVALNVPSSGLYEFAVTITGEGGTSQRATVKQWVGKVAPMAPEFLTMAREEGSYDINLFWQPVEKDVNGNTLSGVKYDVYRCTPKKKTLVAQDLAETSFSETLVNPELAEHFYEVYAKNGDAVSEAAKSDSEVFGDAIEPDYSEDFSKVDGTKLYSIIDVNGDGKSWKYDSENKCMRTYYSDEKGTADDDWLVTPKVRLTADRTYTVKFRARNRYEKYPNSLEVKWGNGNTVAQLTNVGFKKTNISSQYTEYEFVITPQADGDYYVGFHNVSPYPDYGVLNLNLVEIDANALLISPAAPTNLTAKAGEKGALTATVSFNAPSLNGKGEKIQTLDNVQLRRNGKLIHEFGKVAGGEALSFEDKNVPNDGEVTYTVTGFVGENEGDKATVKVWVGTDLPLNPKNVTIASNGTTIYSSWDKFDGKGEHGGYANPDDVKVSVYSIEDYGDGQMYLGSRLAVSEPGETSVDLGVDPEASVYNDGKQSLYTVAAHTEGREQIQTNYVFSSSMVVGPSIKLPFRESFADGYVDNELCWTENNDAVNNRSTAAQWMTSTWESADNDGGCVMWTPYQTNSGASYTIKSGDESAFCVAKTTLANAKNPQLHFSYNISGKCDLEAIVKLPDGTEKVVKAISNEGSETGWKTCDVDLSEFKSEKSIVCKFKGISRQNNPAIYVDNINVVDNIDYNLAATGLKVDDNLKAGRQAKAQVEVKNYGLKDAAGFGVELYLNKKKVAEKTVESTLASFASATVDLSFGVPANAGNRAELYATVVYDLDQNDTDNSTDKKVVNVSPVKTATVSDLGASSADGGVSLTWSKPSDNGVETVTESFESYTPWSTSFGDWTLVNGNPDAEACNLFGEYESPFKGEKFAFIIFDPATCINEGNILDVYPGYDAHSGNQYAAVPYEWTEPQDDSQSGFVDGDNWLISPKLSGNAQTVSFYVNNICASSDSPYTETFDVLVSLGSNKVSNFKKVASEKADGDTPATEDTNWKRVTVSLPKGSQYFAIHQNTPADQAYLFGVDDITYEIASECSNDEIVGYNIYRDGELIASVDGSTLSYTDTEAGAGNGKYNVTIVFRDSQGNTTESAFSNTATLATSIEAIETIENASEYNVYTLDGKTVMLGAASLNGLQPGVYVINGRTYILK